MKFTLAIVAALASVSAAAPSKGKCTPGTYACINYPAGWKVCNTSGKWEFAGNCPPDTVCKFFQPSLSPYCVPADFTIT
ncbi:hypothetical protein LIA77_05883 [Sarocladium implicatum]|nr:hypothetical protein LIA77_05883 [Sarocladium implicatum]